MSIFRSVSKLCQNFSRAIISPTNPPRLLFHALAAGRTFGIPSLNKIAEAPQLLRPTFPHIVQINGFKVKGRLKRRCKDCYFVVRQERLYVICKTHPRHKQMSMVKKEKNTWILTDATQSKERQW